MFVVGVPPIFLSVTFLSVAVFVVFLFVSVVVFVIFLYVFDSVAIFDFRLPHFWGSVVGELEFALSPHNAGCCIEG